MKNLGKILTLLILFLSSLSAGVTASVSPNDVFVGDTTTYMLTITGSGVKKPVMSDICGNQITATGSQTSIQATNGEYKKSYTLSYQFTPKKSCTIAAVGVEIDGKIEYSNSVDVNVLPRTQDLSADFVLEFKSSVQELYVGEPFKLTLLLKQKRGIQVADSKFIAPEFKGFWIKSESQPQRTQDSKYMTTKVVYELAPQREGKLSIEAAELKVASRVASTDWMGGFAQVRWRTYYSNTLDISVKALPENVKIIGDFTIEADVDKREINPNEAVNLKIKITGVGNLEDIESFKPFISDVNIFDEKIQLTSNSLSQKIVFVSERDFTIPTFELKYFDINTKEVKTIKTEPIEIKVQGNMAKKELSITRGEAVVPKTVEEAKREVVEKNNYLYLSLAFILGLSIGIALMLLRGIKFSKKSKTFDIKDEKVLLIKLLAFKDSDKDVEELVRILENNIYSKEKIALNKKKLKEVLKKYDIS
ncbi:BatD family protein [Sulfurimonas sp. SAG-AH-194-L11]|nr:BatD family protein [Sulfurimonas sp. SAG-AH-194-L11]MDF1876434.1 BatD family protein [Sulfurimonas sp. SAG-AH-194-L11]